MGCSDGVTESITHLGRGREWSEDPGGPTVTDKNPSCMPGPEITNRTTGSAICKGRVSLMHKCTQTQLTTQQVFLATKGRIFRPGLLRGAHPTFLTAVSVHPLPRTSGRHRANNHSTQPVVRAICLRKLKTRSATQRLLKLIKYLVSRQNQLSSALCLAGAPC